MATRVSTTNLDDIKLTHIKLEVDGDGIAVMTFDSQDQKVNTLSLAVADDFDTVMDRVESEKSIRALVITSAKKGNFIAGADISLIRNAKTAAESTQMARSLQDRFMRLEEIHTRLKKPVVVAIDGSCMGGGTEMSLACSMRLASNEKHTVIALPEVQLGVFPGAGGTQRLPRLIGIANALDVILTGKNLRPKKALKLGLVDEIMPAAILLETAKKRALAAAKGERKGPKRGLARLKELANEFSDPDHLQQLVLEENIVGRNLLFKKAKEALLKKTLGNYPGPEKALEVIRVGIEEGLEAGYAAEADRFGQLAVSDQAQALMGIFFATTELKRDNGVDDDSVEAKPVKKLAMLGSGLMGGGIATMSVTKAKVPVRLKDINDEGIRSGLAYVGKILAKDVKRRRKSRVEADQIMQMITTTQDYSGFGDVDLVIEAVPEVLELKRKVLKDVEAATRPDTIFASNTSSLPITEIAKGASRPENVIGMHYFSPVEKMPLLEIITTEKTADWVTATCVQAGKKQGKTVIVVRDGTGFYTSRILAPYMNEAAWLISEGAAGEAIDKALVDWGYPVGPITLLDEVGIDVGIKVAGIMKSAFGERMQAPEAMQKLSDDNRMGRKNGRGFYLYEDGKKGALDESVYELFGQDSVRKEFDPKEIYERVGLQMINEAALCLEEGILRSARDGDIGAVFGLGFPPFRGGPFRYIDTVGADSIVERLEHYESIFGERFAPAKILKDYAKKNKKFLTE